MKRRQAICSILILGSLPVSAVWANEAKDAQAEIEFLLDYVDVSGCQFYRNGSWHDAKAAQEHLRSKYQFLSARNQINTAEDFIEKAATKSSFSGQPYRVGCQGAEAISSNQWLTAALSRFRISHRHQN
jgi:hypothetical protein